MTIRILAVEDPAVLGYVENLELLKVKSPYAFEFQVVPWKDYYPKMMRSFQGAEQYDVVMVAGHLWLYDFVKKGYLEPLSLEGKGTIVETIRSEMNNQGVEYLSPSFCDGHMVIYRKDIVHSILGRNLGEMISPLDYAELARLISEKTGKASIAMKAHHSEIFTDALPFLREKGAPLYDRHGKVVEDMEALKIGIEFYCSLKNYAMKDSETFGNTEVKNAIVDHHIPLTTTWSGQLGDIFHKNHVFDENIGFSTLSSAWNVTWSFAISKTGKNKEKAKEVLKYLRSPEVDQLISSRSGAPVLEETYKSGEKIYPWFKIQKVMLDKAQLLPDIQNAGTKNQIIYDEIYACFTGKCTAGKAAENIIKAIRVIEQSEDGGEKVLNQ